MSDRYWHVYAGISPEGHGLGGGVLTMVTLNATVLPEGPGEVPISGDFSAQWRATFDHEPTADEVHATLPQEWQERYADEDWTTDADHNPKFRIHDDEVTEVTEDGPVDDYARPANVNVVLVEPAPQEKQ